MCSLDHEEADVCRQEDPVARKPHRCWECNLPIVVGCRHMKITTLYDGGWSTYRIHHDCAALRVYVTVHVCEQGPDEVWYGGDLREEVRSHMHDDPSLVRRWRTLLRARRAEGTWPIRQRQVPR